MENNKIKQFIDLLLNGETIGNAIEKADIGDMNLHDLCITISGVQFAYMFENFIRYYSQNFIKKIKDLDNALVDIRKSTDK